DTLRLDARHGPVAGAMEGVAYREDTRVLEPGATLLLFTDGVTEATGAGGELFSEARLLDLLPHAARPGSAPLVDEVIASVHAFEGAAEQADDITVLAFRFQGERLPGSRPVTVSKTWHGLQASDAVIAWFETFADTHALDDPVRRKVKLVLDELLANVMAYGWPDSPVGAIEVGLKLRRGDLVITLSDDGVPFNPLQASRPDVQRALSERKPGGLGIHLTRELMDELSYRRSADRNIVTLRTRPGVT
ncbi:MAG: ATP-binding protein, partial [Thiogranum sp.]